MSKDTFANLERAIAEHIGSTMDSAPPMVTGYVVIAARLDPREDSISSTSYSWIAADGQAVHVTMGLADLLDRFLGDYVHAAAPDEDED